MVLLWSFVQLLLRSFARLNSLPYPQASSRPQALAPKEWKAHETHQIA